MSGPQEATGCIMFVCRKGGSWLRDDKVLCKAELSYLTQRVIDDVGCVPATVACAG